MSDNPSLNSVINKEALRAAIQDRLSLRRSQPPFAQLDIQEIADLTANDGYWLATVRLRSPQAANGRIAELFADVAEDVASDFGVNVILKLAD